MDITLSEITEVATLPECEPLKTTRYWQTDVRLISGRMLDTLHTELEQTHGQAVADACMKALLNQAVHDFMFGQIDNEQLLSHELPIRAKDIASALASLNAISGMERSAVLFSLIERTRLIDTVRLRWGDVEYKKLHRTSADLLQSTPVHLDSSYVFWTQEPDRQHPSPLSDFVRKFMQLADMNWARFAQCIEYSGIDFTKKISSDAACKQQQHPI